MSAKAININLPELDLEQGKTIEDYVGDFDVVTFDTNERTLDEKFFERVLEYSRYSHPHIQPPLRYHREIKDENRFKGYVVYPKIGHEKMERYLKLSVAKEELDKIILKFIYQLSLGIDSLHQSKYAKRSCIVLRHVCLDLLFVETSNGDPTARIRVQSAVKIEQRREDSNPPKTKLPCGCLYDFDPLNPFNTIKRDWKVFGEVIETLLSTILEITKEDLVDGTKDREILQFLLRISGLMKEGLMDRNELREVSLPYEDAHQYVKALHKESVGKWFRIPAEIPLAEGPPLCHACLRDEICPKTYLRQARVEESDFKCTEKCCYYCHHCYTVAPPICKEHGPAQSIFGGFALIVYGVDHHHDFEVKVGNTFEKDAKEFFYTLAHNSICNIPYENMICAPLYYVKKDTKTESGFELDQNRRPKEKLEEYEKLLIEKIEKSKVKNPIVWFVYIGHGSKDDKWTGGKHTWDPIKCAQSELRDCGISFVDRRKAIKNMQQKTSPKLRYVNCSCYSNAEEILSHGDTMQIHSDGKQTFRTTPQLICQIMRGGCHPNCQREKHLKRYDGHGLLTSENIMIETSWQKVCERNLESDSKEETITLYTCSVTEEAEVELPVKVDTTGEGVQVLGMCQLHHKAAFRLHKYNRGPTDAGCDFLYHLDLYIFNENQDGGTELKYMKNYPDLIQLKNKYIEVQKDESVLFLTNEGRGYSNYSLVMQHDMRPYLQRGSLYYVHDRSCQITLEGFCKECQHSPVECDHHAFRHVQLPTSPIEDPELGDFFKRKNDSEENSHMITEVPNLLLLTASQLFHEYEEDVLQIPSSNRTSTQQAVYDILKCFGMDMDTLTSDLVDANHKEKYSIWRDSMAVLQYRHIKDSKHLTQFKWDDRKKILTFTPADQPDQTIITAPAGEVNREDSNTSTDNIPMTEMQGPGEDSDYD